MWFPSWADHTLYFYALETFSADLANYTSTTRGARVALWYLTAHSTMPASIARRTRHPPPHAAHDTHHRTRQTSRPHRGTGQQAPGRCARREGEWHAVWRRALKLAHRKSACNTASPISRCGMYLLSLFGMALGNGTSGTACQGRARRVREPRRTQHNAAPRPRQGKRCARPHPRKRCLGHAHARPTLSHPPAHGEAHLPRPLL